MKKNGESVHRICNVAFCLTANENECYVMIERSSLLKILLVVT